VPIRFAHLIPRRHLPQSPIRAHRLPPALFAAALITLALATPASALNCIVADPTGSPLDIRLAPNGKVVATARKGTRIQVFEGEEKYDNQRPVW
jgi:hypothetical protein